MKGALALYLHVRPTPSLNTQPQPLAQGFQFQVTTHDPYTYKNLSLNGSQFILKARQETDGLHRLLHFPDWANVVDKYKFGAGI